MIISIPNIIEYELGGTGFVPIVGVLSVGVGFGVGFGSTGFVGLTALRPQTN